MSGIIDKFHVFGKVCYEPNIKENAVDIKVIQFYLNNTDVDIMVLHRNSLPIKVDRSTGGAAGIGSFIIRNVYRFHSNGRIVDTITNLTNYRERFKSVDEELVLIHESLKQAYVNDRTISLLDIVIDKEIPIRSIRDQSAFYIPEADLVICDSRSFLKYPHPYSKEGLTLSAHHDFIQTNHVSGVFVELIDNENTIKNRYMYVAKQLIEIPARKDQNKSSGVYFTVAQFDKHNEVTLDPRCYSFDDAEKELGLYKTREEAYTGGHPEALASAEQAKALKELAEAKSEIEKNKLNIEHIRHENELEKINHQRQLADWEHQNAETKQALAKLELEIEDKKRYAARLKEELEIVRAMRTHKSEKKKDKAENKKRKRDDFYEDKKRRREDYYEDRSYVRKDSHEYVKTGAMLLAAGLSVYAVLSKNKIS